MTPKTYIYSQADEIAKGEDTIGGQEVTISGARIRLKGAIFIKETSARRLEFKKRHHGGWLWRNLHNGDTVVVATLHRLGCSMRDILGTLKRIYRRGATLVVVLFNDREQITLSGSVLKFFIRSFGAVMECSREIKISCRTIAGRKKRWGTRVQLTGDGERVVWDTAHLRSAADMAKQLYLDCKPFEDVANEYRLLGARDSNGRLLGASGARVKHNALTFLSHGLDGQLPPQWNDTAEALASKMRAVGLGVPWNEIEKLRRMGRS